MARLVVAIMATLLTGADSFLPAQEARFLPPQGKRLLIVGQDLGAIGGFAETYRDGYYDKVSTSVGGVTTYTNLPDLIGIKTLVNVGAGDLHAQRIVDNPVYRHSTLAIGLYLVDQLESINRGEQDAKIDELGRWIQKAGRPVFLRIGYEFDGYWNHYDPGPYQKTFRRIVDRFRKLNVENCAFVWQSGTSPVDDAIEKTHEDIAQWYPGDDYVDWCACSWFLHSDKQVELADELLDFSRQHGKPVMVAECAPQAYDLAAKTKRNFNTMIDGPPGEDLRRVSSQQIWDEWYRPFLQYINNNDDVIRCVAYINVNWDAQPMWGPPYKEGYWGDTRVQSDPAIREKWLQEIAKPSWLHGSDQLFHQLGYRH